MDFQPEKSPERRSPTISLATPDRQFGIIEDEKATYPLIPITSMNLRVRLARWLLAL